MKRKLFSLAVITICLSIVGTGTYAYFTDNTIAHNVISMGEIDIALLEWADENKTEPFPTEGITGVMPGTSVTKIVEVANTGGNAAWVRVKVDKDITLANGDDGDADTYLSIDYNTGEESNQWQQHEEYFYYNQPLAPNEKTAPLFKQVSFAHNMGNEYQNSTAQVYIFAQAVQADNNDEAEGWPSDDSILEQ